MAVSLASLVHRARCLHFAVCRSQILVICGGADSCPQISYNLWRAQFGSPPRFCPFVSTVQRYRLLPLTLFEWADHSKIFFPFVRLQSADRHLQISSMLVWLRLFSHNLLFLRLPRLDAVYLLRNQICRARSTRTPRCCCPPAVVAQVDLLSTLRDVSTNLRYLQGSSNRLSLTTSPRPYRRGRRHRIRVTVLTRTAQARHKQCWRERTTIPSRRIQHLTPCSNIII